MPPAAILIFRHAMPPLPTTVSVYDDARYAAAITLTPRCFRAADTLITMVLMLMLRYLRYAAAPYAIAVAAISYAMLFRFSLLMPCRQRHVDVVDAIYADVFVYAACCRRDTKNTSHCPAQCLFYATRQFT